MVNKSWLLRWDRQNQEKPQVVLPQDGGSRMVATLPEEAESWVIFDGYLFDLDRLLPERGATEAACVAHAYQRRGEGLFDELRGGFALAVWDHAQERLTAGRDALGLHPLYYWWDGHLLILSPEIDLILGQPEVRGEFNRVVLAEYLQDIWHAHQRSETFYAEVRRVPAAHRLWLDHHSQSIERYWDPLPEGFAWANEEELETFQPLLEQAVARCLAAGADSLALSGGFDSVSLAVVASGQLQRKRPLHAVSLRFTMRDVDEGQTQMAVAQALGMPQVMRTLEECLEGTSFAEASLALSKTSPTPVLNQWQSMYTRLLESASALGFNKLMMGTGGDEMFTVDPIYAADRLAALDWRGLWRFYQAMARYSPFSPLLVARVVFWNYAAKPEMAWMIRSTLDRMAPRLSQALRRRHLAVKPWVAAGDRDLRQILEHRRLNPYLDEPAPQNGAYLRALRGLLQAPLLMTEMEQSFSWARQAGFTLMYPYFDRHLVALALRIHPEHLLARGRAKALLRRLVKERLPGVNLPVKKVDFTQPVHELLRLHGQAAWRNLKRPLRLAELGIIDAAHIEPIIEDYFAGRYNRSLRIWQVLSAETWLRSREN